MDTTYDSFTVSFVSPTDGLSKYRLVFEGKELTNGRGFIKGGKNKGKLDVYDKGNNTLVFSEPIAIKSEEDVQLILYNGKINLFSSEQFIPFKLKYISSSDKSDDYSFFVDGNECNPNGSAKNFVEKGKGAILSVKDKDGNEVIKDTIDIKPNVSLIVWKSGSSYKILSGVNDDNPPKTPNIEKANFYYDVNFLLKDIDSIQVKIYSYKKDLYNWDGTADKVYEFNLKKGELSQYYEFDLTKYGKDTPTAYCASVYNAKDGSLLFDGTKIRSGRIQFDIQYSDPMAYIYKYQTIRLRVQRTALASHRPESAFNSDPWETTNQ